MPFNVVFPNICQADCVTQKYTRALQRENSSRPMKEGVYLAKYLICQMEENKQKAVKPNKKLDKRQRKHLFSSNGQTINSTITRQFFPKTSPPTASKVDDISFLSRFVSVSVFSLNFYACFVLSNQYKSGFVLFLFLTLVCFAPLSEKWIVKQRNTKQNRQIKTNNELVTCYFTPRQPVWLYQDKTISYETKQNQMNTYNKTNKQKTKRNDNNNNNINNSNNKNNMIFFKLRG